MKFYLIVAVLLFVLNEVFALNCYTCLNGRLEDCLKSNQTCRHGMDQCFSMQKEALDGGHRYTKLCADEWYCERHDAACHDLDEPEYSYMECRVGCCENDLCNGAESLFTRSFGWVMLSLLVSVALNQLQ